MSKVMQSMYRQGRDARKPWADRRRYEVGTDEWDEVRASGRTGIVYLNGERIDRCTVADEIEGYVVRILYPYQIVNDEILTQKLRGVVGVDLVDQTP